jgi:hypothetical protein
MEIGTMAQWAGASATFCAVLVALFREPFVRWRRLPKLVAEVAACRPYCIITPNGEDAGGGLRWDGCRYFIRLWVKNQGKSRADKVEVFLSGVRIRQTDGSLRELRDVSPMNLRWSYTNYKEPEIYADGISPGMGKLCDFAAVSDPKTPSLKFVNAKDCLLSLRLEALPPMKEWLAPAKYEFDVMIAGSNCPPAKQTIRLHLTGLWSDDPDVMLQNGIRFD